MHILKYLIFKKECNCFLSISFTFKRRFILLFYLSALNHHEFVKNTILKPHRMKQLLLFPLFLLSSYQVGAQFSHHVCVPPSVTNPRQSCQFDCTYCGFDGYSGSTPLVTDLSMYQPDLCGIFASYIGIAFVASGNFVTIVATPSNCQNGDGLQSSIHNDCLTHPFEPPISCDIGMLGGGNMPVVVSAPTIPGLWYDFTLGGYNGDACDFVIEVFPPGAAIAPVPGDINAEIEGNISVLCPGGTAYYSLPLGPNIGGYIWTAPPGWFINGMPTPISIPGELNSHVEITAGPNTGSAQVCARAFNACYPDGGDTICRTFTVEAIPITDLGISTVCKENLPYTLPWGVDVNTAGNYMATLDSYLGCDSVVKQQVVVYNNFNINLGIVTACEGEPYYVCDQPFTSVGAHTAMCSTYQGCDSIVKFTLNFVQSPVAQINGSSVLDCSTNSIVLKAETSPFGTGFTWKNMAGQVLSTTDSLKVSTPGTYYLYATLNSNGTMCSKADSIVIINNITPPALNISGGNLTCVADSVQLISSTNAFNPGWSWSGPGGFSATLANPVVYLPGAYTVTVSSAGSALCTASATLTVSEDKTAPTFYPSGATLSCRDTLVQISVDSVVGNATYLWSGPNGFHSNLQTPSVNVAGDYAITVTSSLNGCSATASATVASNTTPPGATAAGGTVTCAAPSLSLMGNSPVNSVIFVWSGPNNFNSLQQNPVVNLAGLYNLSVTDTLNGCISTASTNVIADQTAPVASSSSGTLTCAQDSLTLNASATLPSTYVWNGPNGFVSSLQNPVVNIPGNYTLIASAGNGCMDTLSVTVGADFTAPGALASGDTIDCTHPQAQISATSSAGISYLWSGPNNFSDTLQNNVVSEGGMYSVTVTGANGCTSSDVALVALNTTAPDLQISAPDLLNCLLTSVVIDASISSITSALQGISWAGPNGFVSTQEDLLVSVPGVYILTASSINGCSATAQITVNQDTLAPDISANGGVLNCSITSLQLQGGSNTPSVNFSWTGPNNFSASVEDPVISESGVYTLIVSGVNGCKSSAEAMVLRDTIAPDLTASFANNLDCIHLSTLLNGNSQTGSLNFLWTGPNNFNANTASTTTTTPGAYQLMATAPNGCTSTSSVTVTQDLAVPDAAAQGDTIDCISGEASLIGNSATLGVSYTWTGPNNFSSSLQNPDVTQDGIYTLTVTGVNGCTSTATANVVANALSPEVMLDGGGTLTCGAQDVSITGIISSPGATGVWTGPNNFSASTSSISISIPGIYTYTVTGLNGCVTALSSTVLQDLALPQGVTVTGGQLNCNTSSITLGASSSTPGVVFEWTGPDNFISNLPNPVVSNPGVYTLVVSNPGNGCSSSATAEVTEDPTVPDVSVSSDSLTCLMQNVTLNAGSNTLGVSFGWTGPNGFVSNLEDPTVAMPGIYTVTVTAPSGCTATLDYALTQNVDLPDAVVQGDTLTCTQPNGQISCLSPAPGAMFSWSGPGGFSSAAANPVVTLAGNYSVIVTASNGCSYTATVTVTPDQNTPIISATGAELTCLISSANLAANADQTVDWNWSGPGGFSSSLQNPVVTAAGEYQLTATGANGCTSSTSVIVTADTKGPDISVGHPDMLDCTTMEVGLQVQATGPGDFVYQWTTANGLIVSGANTPTPLVSKAGDYQVLVINNSNGCSATANVLVELNPAVPSGAILGKTDISCFGKADGTVIVKSVQGGTPPLLYSIDHQAFIADAVFAGLQPGVHTISIQDAAGCEYQTSFEVFEPKELTVNLGPDTTIFIGDSLVISSTVINHPERVEQLIITPADLRLDSIFQPLNSLTYSVTVIDSNGCEASDQRHIEVDRTHHIYIPNIFNPNSNLNPVLYIFGGQDVLEIESFQIFDRWGDHVFEQFHFKPNDPALGWSGKYRSLEVNPGVFVFQAMVHFVDGERKLYKGDITVVR